MSRQAAIAIQDDERVDRRQVPLLAPLGYLVQERSRPADEVRHGGFSAHHAVLRISWFLLLGRAKHLEAVVAERRDPDAPEAFEVEGR